MKKKRVFASALPTCLVGFLVGLFVGFLVGFLVGFFCSARCESSFGASPTLARDLVPRGRACRSNAVSVTWTQAGSNWNPLPPMLSARKFNTSSSMSPILSQSSSVSSSRSASCIIPVMIFSPFSRSGMRFRWATLEESKPSLRSRQVRYLMSLD